MGSLCSMTRLHLGFSAIARRDGLPPTTGPALSICLLDHPPADADQLRHILDTRLAYCVITKAEDAAITAAGFGTRMVPGAEQDPWARYREAGIDPGTFALYLKSENSHQVS
jgi:hypothetical protein